MNTLNMKKQLLIILTIFGIFYSLNAQVDRNEIQEYLNTFAQESEFKVEDVSNWEITDAHIDKRNGIQFVYIRQKISDIPVQNGLANFAIKNGKVVHMGNRLISELNKEVPNSSPSISADVAIGKATEELNINQPSGLVLVEQESKRKYLYSKADISLEEIPVELMYMKDKEGELQLVWNLSIYETSAENWWSVSIDAHSGKMLRKVNWVQHCEFGEGHKHEESADQNIINNNAAVTTKSVTGSEYRVFALPAESPNHGPYVLVSDPSDSLASPFAWHDTDGVSGPEYTITRGNNVHAYEDVDGSNGNNPGNSPDGTSALHFDFPFTPGTAPSSYQDAAVTNLFYLNNMMHDIWYYYGFDEASGNFQQNNYGRGGLGSDYVRAEAQDGGGTNNANFATPSDGNRPRMQMYLWGNGNSARDGDFDNGIIAHEYGHGISNRLTGGASTTGCLSNDEQMGEGWSDWFGLMITIEPGDLEADRRGIGTFAINQAVNGTGIRPAPYTTDFNINNYTYGRTNSGLSRPHGIGFVFATALWDLNWALINQYGGVPDTNLYTGTGGNNIAMDLVMTGLKLQPCSPGMIDGRDAILAADDLLYGGIHKCLIWDVFANRGFGYSAQQGDPDNRSDQIESFMPSPFCQTVSAAPIADFEVDTLKLVCNTEILFTDSSLNTPQHWFWDFGDGTTDTFPSPFHTFPDTGTYNVTLIVENPLGSDTIMKTINIGVPKAPVVADRTICSGTNVPLVATGNITGPVEWYDLGQNLLSTGVLYLRIGVTNDETYLVRENRTNNISASCYSEFDSVFIKVAVSDFTYNQNGATFNFTDASSNATSWRWEFGDGNISTLQNPSHTYAQVGNYDVKLRLNGLSCSKTETVSVISGIDGTGDKGLFSLFPNPSKGNITVKLVREAKSGMYYSIQDLNGKIIKRARINQGSKSFNIEINDFESAMYLIQIEGSDFTEVRKLLLEK